jgi:hypothetical protein
MLLAIARPLSFAGGRRYNKRPSRQRGSCRFVACKRRRSLRAKSVSGGVAVVIGLRSGRHTIRAVRAIGRPGPQADHRCQRHDRPCDRAVRCRRGGLFWGRRKGQASHSAGRRHRACRHRHHGGFRDPRARPGDQPQRALMGTAYPRSRVSAAACGPAAIFSTIPDPSSVFLPTFF